MRIGSHPLLVLISHWPWPRGTLLKSGSIFALGTFFHCPLPWISGAPAEVIQSLFRFCLTRTGSTARTRDGSDADTGSTSLRAHRLNTHDSGAHLYAQGRAAQHLHVELLTPARNTSAHCGIDQDQPKPRYENDAVILMRARRMNCELAALSSRLHCVHPYRKMREGRRYQPPEGCAFVAVPLPRALLGQAFGFHPAHAILAAVAVDLALASLLTLAAVCGRVERDSGG
jgi:hypothetical protein